MRYTHLWVDVSEHLRRGVRPVYLHERPLGHGDDPKGGLFNATEVARRGAFWVPEGDPRAPDCPWALYDRDRYARIPLTAYRLPRALAALPAFGLELGAAAVAALEAQAGRWPLELVWVVATEVTDLGDAFRCYVGLALRVQDDDGI